jgi:predicted kinase
VGRTRLVLVCGLPGSGKTTTALSLAVELGAVRLCPDEWLARLGFDGHDEAARGRVEQLQWQLAQELLQRGQSVVLESGFWSRDERTEFRQRARELGVAVELRHLDVDVAELWRRLAARNAALPARTYVVTKDHQLELYVSLFQAPTRDELAQFDAPLDAAR